MKNSNSIVVWALFLVGIGFTQFSCQKNAGIPPANISIPGTWAGTQAEDGSSINNAIRWTIKTDNTLDMFIDGSLMHGSGTWQLLDNAFTATYVYPDASATTYVYTATYDPKTGKLSSGIWVIRGTSTRGIWTITKQ
ncbi:MAG: hypothetical protein ACKOWL_01295 [Sphingobacteriaceae bacterium]